MPQVHVQKQQNDIFSNMTPRDYNNERSKTKWHNERPFKNDTSLIKTRHMNSITRNVPQLQKVTLKRTKVMASIDTRPRFKSPPPVIVPELPLELVSAISYERPQPSINHNFTVDNLQLAPDHEKIKFTDLRFTHNIRIPSSDDPAEKVHHSRFL